jgi:4,4'-diaponeurosporenoate glycosyltransferase
VLNAAVVTAGLLAGSALLDDPRPLPRARRRLASVPSVSVVIPARDEATRLPVLLRSLAALDPQPHEVIVVDDGSIDDTAAIAAASGVTVVNAGDPPAGWLGKPWACHRGAQLASGSHLLFLDSDTALGNSALADLDDVHRRGRGGLVSVQPFHCTGRRDEDLSAYFNTVAMMGTGVFASRLRDVATAAFGPCLYTSCADYQRSGGHDAVRHEIVEDLALARRFRRAGMPVSCFTGDGTVTYRMYENGPTQLLEGWSKNIAAGAAGAHPLAVAGTCLWVVAHVLAASEFVKVVLATSRRRRPTAMALLSVGATIIHQRNLLRRVGSFRLATAVAFPAPLAVFVTTFAHSLFLTTVRRQVTWKRRAIALGDRQVE